MKESIVINAKTLVPAGITYGAIVLAAVGAWKISGELSAMHQEQKAFREHIMGDWNFADQETWAAQLQIRNPNLSIPAPKDFKHLPPPATASTTLGNALTATIP